MARRKRQTWDVGSYFVVPLQDGTFGLGQIISHEPKALDSVVCAFFDWRGKLASASEGVNQFIVAAFFVTRDLLDSGRWKVINSGAPADIDEVLDLDSIRARRYLRTTIHGSANAETLLNVWHGVVAWDTYPNVKYLKSMLTPRALTSLSA